MKCFDDLRVDMVVDELSKCWIVKICSLDYLTLKPPQEYNESPNKAKYLKIIETDQKAAVKTISESLKAQFSSEKGVETKKCGFCHIAWPRHYISSELTAKVLKKAYDAMLQLGLPTGSIVPPSYSENDEKFHVWVKNVQICQMCSQLVTTVNESLRLSRRMSQGVGTTQPRPQRIGLIERTELDSNDLQTLRSFRISVFLGSVTFSKPGIVAGLTNLKLSYRILGHDFNMDVGSM